ncbi:hypothetical protein [Rhizobium rhizoryzae]|uniref:Uncharacterized protein n=1 Tax=Rhizobium rhizoryzae TaxID=451876 RepID=A0A7W6LCL0_9HYPH|nr:hypothetical protein [Rhizobium rhizoryzae]MBB4141905.1 hypothetical protein [Rhizobium rhizoryzae]
MAKDGATDRLIASFGVGCFHFQCKVDLGAKGFPNYVSLVQDYISRDNLIKDVKFTEFQDEISLQFLDGNSAGDIGDLYYLYPSLGDSVLSFNIMIPHRLQVELLSGWRGPLRSENFKVTLFHYEGMPIAIVKPELLEESPSIAVSMIWKHIRRNWTSAEIQFSMLGPSPFHGDFFVHSDDEPVEKLIYSEQYGYDRIDIYVPTSVNKEMIEDFIIYRIRKDISLYYYLINRRNIMFDSFRGIVNKIDTKLENEDKNPRVSGFFSRVKFDAYRSLIHIDQLDSSIQSLDQHRRDVSKSIEQLFGESFLAVKNEGVIQELKDIPLRSYKNIISTIKERSAAKTNNVTIVVAAILGVLVGFFIQNSYIDFLKPMLVTSSASKEPAKETYIPKQ